MIKKQIDKSKTINGRLLKLLGEISTNVVNFRSLREVVQKPEVAVDYRDLDYLEKLEFVDGVEPPLEYVTEMVNRAKQMLEDLEKEYDSFKDNEEAGKEITEIQRKLRDNQDLQTIADQEAEVKKTLEELKERRKRFSDCNIQS